MTRCATLADVVAALQRDAAQFAATRPLVLSERAWGLRETARFYCDEANLDPFVRRPDRRTRLEVARWYYRAALGLEWL